MEGDTTITNSGLDAIPDFPIAAQTKTGAHKESGILLILTPIMLT